MLSDVYLCHLLLEKYPQLETEMETLSPEALSAEIPEGEQELARREIDRLMMADWREISEIRDLPALLPFIWQLFAAEIDVWEYRIHHNHIILPKDPFLLAIREYVLGDAVMEGVVYLPDGRLSLFFSGAEDYSGPPSEEWLSGIGLVDLELRFSGVPQDACWNLRRLEGCCPEPQFWALWGEGLACGMTLSPLHTHMLGENAWCPGGFPNPDRNHFAYFPFRSGEILPAPYGTYRQ